MDPNDNSGPLEAAYQVRHLARLIETHDDGDTAAELNRMMAEAVEAATAHAAEHGGVGKATLTVTVSLEADAKGVAVSIAGKSTLPRRPNLKDRFFVTADGHLTRRNPNRGTLFEGQDLGRTRRGA